MKDIIKKFKRVILKKRLKRVELECMELEVKIKKHSDIIIKLIARGKNELKVARLQLERDGLYDRKKELVTIEYSLRRQLLRGV